MAFAVVLVWQDDHREVGERMDQRKLLAIGAAIGGVIAAGRFLRSKGRGRIMERMMERMPPDSPPKLVMSILPRLREQNDEIVALLREQNELLRRKWPEVTRGSEIPS
jgi:hypothetical protein